MKSRLLNPLLIAPTLLSLASAQQLFLHPAPSASSVGTVAHVDRVLAQHLHIEAFDVLDQEYDDDLFESGPMEFVGQGLQSALLLEVVADENSQREFIPESLHLSHSFQNLSLDVLAQIRTLFSNFLSRAKLIYSAVFSYFGEHTSGDASYSRTLDILSTSNSPSVENFLRELTPLVDFLDEQQSGRDSFGAYIIHGLDDIRKELGEQSLEYQTCVAALKAALESAVSNNVRIALVVSPPSTSSLQKRVEPPAQSPLPSVPSSLPVPQEPFYSTSTCYTSLESCQNSTYSCYGHGACTNMTRTASTRSCFVCACGATKDDKGRTQYWAGEACERKDLSVPTTLLAGTTIFLIVVIAGSISFLYGAGTGPLPSTLTGPGVGVHH
ncbi:hypothetical protein SISNIDRAFT_481287 [Sistotremastrum niveocremeum HHB9708]|uniref:Vacuolar sorting protein Vps3844 C-terminal domain-containing protein n=2 Tax=Sistotremastraceae TaxID=3402574 RepID=A0A165A703_9AGAM|nr:hypothetical protein SISNIDRAFT_481287 [Sistotremastrum niveocremeum HHB9708]KZT43506.1 hypothetical protein SISSUDRAFT_1039934 [Sistotremastrum suecicum HHB10207 ss-3]